MFQLELRMDIMWPDGARMNTCPTGHRPRSIWTVAFALFLGPVEARFPFRSLVSSPLPPNQPVKLV